MSRRLRAVGALVPLFLLLTFGIGCGGPVRTLRQGTTVVCRAVAAGYRALDGYDEIRQGEIRKVIATSPDEAIRQLDAYLVKYKPVRMLIDEAEDQCELAATVADRIEAHKMLPAAAPTDITVWVIDLLALAPRIIAALNDLGIKLDLGGTR